MNMTNQRLAKARCAQHIQYNSQCAACVCRYFLQLIDSDYTPNYVVEKMERDHTCEVAQLRSKVASLNYELACYESSGV